MGALTAITFAAPWILTALAALPVIWWLLRVNPPAPRRIDFPAVRLLFNLRQTEETPTKTPLWLLILRLLLATLLILAAAGPQIDRGPGLGGDGPLLLVIDDGWRAARSWDQRVKTAVALLDRAAADRRSVYLAATAARPDARGDAGAALPIDGPMAATEARDRVQAMRPQPWPSDRVAMLDAIDALVERGIDGTPTIEWLSNGLGGQQPSAAMALGERLMALGGLRVHRGHPETLANALLPPDEAATELRASVLRAPGGPAATRRVRAVGDDGRLLARADISFAEGEDRAEAELALPAELRNEVASLRLEGETSAGGVVLLDERWRRRPVGLVSGGGYESSQPLLSDLYYLNRALAPFHEVRDGRLDTLAEAGLAVIVMVDVGSLVETDRAALDGWVSGGGVLVRFAGPRLAEGDDALLPVRLRDGGGRARALGGALSWEQPMALAPFEETSIFTGLAVPEDVSISRQVLAEPSLDPDELTWARLSDGTPLVTAKRRGDGWLVLFHTTANADWSNLALSGLFVDMMRRIVDLSQGVAAEGAAASLAPLQTLDGFGQLVNPPVNATPIPGPDFADATPAPRTPPGWYGTEGARRALNATAGLDRIVPLSVPSAATVVDYEAGARTDFAGWLLVAAILLAIADTVIALGVRGLLPQGAGRAAGLALALLAGLGATGLHGRAGMAQTLDADYAIAAGAETVFAYVTTGDPEIDTISRQGIEGLSRVLWERTAVEPGRPMAVDPEIDELSFFPWIYWPVLADTEPLTDRTISRIDAYLRGGGLILFDTRDQSPTDRLGGGGRIGSALGRLLEGLNIPPLVRVPDGHAITRAFYLLDRFPGRWDGETIWVERYEGDVNDGVSSVVIGGNAWAAAWARDDDGQALYPVVPGGTRQRELAFRFGVNLAMYALTGNYKADQVHVPAILRRLGQARPDLDEDDDEQFED